MIGTLSTSQWADTIAFDRLPVGHRVVDVPPDADVFDPAWEYIIPRASKPDKQERIMKVSTDWAHHRTRPLWYCSQCRRIEDGSHRIEVASNRHDMLTVDVHGICYSLRAMETRQAIASTCIESGAVSQKQAHNEWLSACERKKWVRFRHALRLAGRSVLDIGSNSGWTLAECAIGGASRLRGIELRPDMVGVSKAFLSALNIRTPRQIDRADLRDLLDEMPPPGARFDLVFFMGLPHYFLDEYERALRWAFAWAEERAIIECRTFPSDKAETRIVGVQTLASMPYLLELAEDCGFSLACSHEFDERRRTVVVFKRVT